MKYCIDCWESFDGKSHCPKCGAKLYDSDEFERFTVRGGVLMSGYGSKIPYGVRVVGSRWREVGRGDTFDIILPNSVKIIESRAFSDRSIKSITMPSSVTHIGNEAFYCCRVLTSVEMQGVKRIGDSAFSLCSELASVTIGSGAFCIGDYAFANCYKLNTVKFGGTRAQWKAVKKGSNWNKEIPAKFVICSDGHAE